MKNIKTTAVWNGKYFQHFGINEKSAVLYGDDVDDIEEVELKISENQLIPFSEQERTDKNVDYWGWFDNEREEITLIWHKRFLLNICFPYGIEATEKVGKGKAYRLEIVS